MSKMKHGLPFVVRLRAHAAGMESLVERMLQGSRSAEDLLALANGPLPLLAAVVGEVRSAKAAVVGVLPVTLGADVSETYEKALAHRAAKEAEVVDLQVPSPSPVGALDQACEVVSRLLAALPGATARIHRDALDSLAAGAGLSPEGAAARLATAGLNQIRSESPDGPDELGKVPVQKIVEAPASLDEAFIAALQAGARGPLALRAGPETTGIQLLRVAAIARLVGYHPITVIGGAELKGPDASLCFGADRIEAELDPAGSLGSRTRAYGEASILGAQLEIEPPRRRAAASGKVAHILDEKVDPALLPGGDPKALEVIP